MAGKGFFDRVYKTQGKREMAALYDEWAAQYDADVGGAGYATPARIAAALAGLLGPGERALPLLDYGCGTGLSGVALKDAGFTDITGCDPAPGMLAKASGLGVYRKTFVFDPLDPPGPDVVQHFPCVVACGVVSVGAAPADVLGTLFGNLAQGARLALSYNSHTLDDPGYMTALRDVQASPHCVTEFEEDGPHLPDLGLISRVLVLRSA